MIEVYEKLSQEYFGAIDDVVVLDHIQREKGRLKLVSEKGRKIGLFLERGKLLKRNDVLLSTCQKYIRVALAKEEVVLARSTSWSSFARACYHLGNRHVRLQIGDLWIRFLKDQVLVDLVEHLGLTTDLTREEFDPESGAYGHGHAGKAHDHEDGHNTMPGKHNNDSHKTSQAAKVNDSCHSVRELDGTMQNVDGAKMLDLACKHHV